jgi:hypothetical protein
MASEEAGPGRSRFLGVSWNTAKRKWEVFCNVRVEGKTKKLHGNKHTHEADAARQADE